MGGCNNMVCLGCWFDSCEVMHYLAQHPSCWRVLCCLHMVLVIWGSKKSQAGLCTMQHANASGADKISYSLKRC